MEFYGAENFMRDVTIRNQRTFALLMANWFQDNGKYLYRLPDHADFQNQDGLHLGAGPVSLNENIQGRSGDDFIALAPDENDNVPVLPILIDGVF